MTSVAPMTVAPTAAHLRAGTTAPATKTAPATTTALLLLQEMAFVRSTTMAHEAGRSVRDTTSRLPGRTNYCHAFFIHPLVHRPPPTHPPRAR